MVVDSLIAALGGYDPEWWHIALAVAAAGIAAVGGFFAFRALRPVVSQWSRAQQAGAAAVVVLVLAGAAYAIYKSFERPGDVRNEDVAFKREKEKKKPKVAKTVNWPVYGYDAARTRFLPSKRVNPPYHASDWSYNAGKLLEFSPVLANGVLYLNDKDALTIALDAKTGKVLWKHDVGALSAASPGFGDGRLFVVTLLPGDLQRLDARTGKVMWEKSLGARSETSPVVYKDLVIVGNESGTVFAFNVHNGDEEWRVDSAGAVKGGVAIDDGNVYFGNYAGQLYSVDVDDGSVNWQTDTTGGSFGRSGPIYSTPAVAYGRVYAGSIDSRVYSYDQETGELAWSQSTGSEVYAGPAVAEAGSAPPSVYIGSSDKNFYALDAQTGDIRWQRSTPSDGPILGAASVIGHVVYVGVIGDRSGTIGYNPKTGKQVFEHELGEYNPAISDGARLYLTGEVGLRSFTPDENPGEPKKKGGGGDGDKGGGEKAGDGGSAGAANKGGGAGGKDKDAGKKGAGGK